MDLEAFLERRTGYGWRRNDPEPAQTADEPREWQGEGEPIPF